MKYRIAMFEFALAMKTTLLISCLLVFGMVFAAMTASASIVAMDFIGPEGNSSGGRYTYPYYFTINGSGTNLLFCDTFSNEISPGQQWNANTLGVGALNSGNVTNLEFPAAGVTGYLEASYLFVEEANAYTGGNTDPKGFYNWAAWDLLSGKDVSGSNLDAGDEAQVQTYLSAAESLGNHGSLTPSQFSNVTIYTPTNTGVSGPQEFFGEVPEPGTVTLVVMGLMSLLAFCHRRK